MVPGFRKLVTYRKIKKRNNNIKDNGNHISHIVELNYKYEKENGRKEA